MRATDPFFESMVSIRPGPWWLKPLWSFRQHVEVRRTFSEAIGRRHSSLMPSASHFACCTVIEAEIIANAS